MTNDSKILAILTDLGNKELHTAEAIVVLDSQGYLVNTVKYKKLSLNGVLLHAFRESDVFASQQLTNLLNLYENFCKI